MNDLDNSLRTIRDIQSLGTAKHKQNLDIQIKIAKEQENEL